MSPGLTPGLRRIRGSNMRIPVRYLRRFHAVATLIWLALVVPSLLWWSHSLVWIILLSVWANVASHFGAWQSTRAEDAAGD
jgi:uncharacterized membrane protein YdbT with pleckstrin-like domain